VILTVLSFIVQLPFWDALKLGINIGLAVALLFGGLLVWLTGHLIHSDRVLYVFIALLES